MSGTFDNSRIQFHTIVFIEIALYNNTKCEQEFKDIWKRFKKINTIVLVECCINEKWLYEMFLNLKHLEKVDLCLLKNDFVDLIKIIEVLASIVKTLSIMFYESSVIITNQEREFLKPPTIERLALRSKLTEAVLYHPQVIKLFEYIQKSLQYCDFEMNDSIEALPKMLMWYSKFNFVPNKLYLNMNNLKSIELLDTNFLGTFKNIEYLDIKLGQTNSNFKKFKYIWMNNGNLKHIAIISDENKFINTSFMQLTHTNKIEVCLFKKFKMQNLIY